jgi:hypothetical protein
MGEIGSVEDQGNAGRRRPANDINAAAEDAA